MERSNKLLQLALQLMIGARTVLGRWAPAAPARAGAGRRSNDGSRGDVPGWVLITLMSAILVAGLLAIAGPALEKLFNEAMAQVQP